MEEIRTPRLLLRRALMSDVHDLHSIFTEPRAMRYWTRPAHEHLSETEDWLRGMVSPTQPADDFAVILNGRMIGKAGAWRLPEIGYILHPDFWGHGYATEALQTLIPYLFDRHQMPALTAEVDPRNQSSIQLLERLGFRKTHFEERTLQWGDEWCDSQYFALPRPN